MFKRKCERQETVNQEVPEGNANCIMPVGTTSVFDKEALKGNAEYFKND